MKTPPARIIRLRICLIICALLLCGAGILLGDTAVIFRKAVYICLECMGLA